MQKTLSPVGGGGVDLLESLEARAAAAALAVGAYKLELAGHLL